MFLGLSPRAARVAVFGILALCVAACAREQTPPVAAAEPSPNAPIGLWLIGDSSISVTAWGQPCTVIANRSGADTMIYVPLSTPEAWEHFRTFNAIEYAVKPCG